MPGKTDRRLIRIEERLKELEKVLREVRRLVDHHEIFLMGDEPLPFLMGDDPLPEERPPEGRKESVMDRIHDKMVEAGVDVEPQLDAGGSSNQPVGPFGVAEEIREKGEEEIPDHIQKYSKEELERKAYELSEEGRDWKEVEEELGMKAPWLAAGRWRKKIERGEV